MGKNNRPTFDWLSEQRAIRLYYGLGLNYESVGRIFGVSKVTVKNLFKRLQLPARTYTEARRVGKYTEEALLACRTKYETGTTIQELERETGLTGYTLSKIFKERGWFKTRKEWNHRFHSGNNSNSRQRALARLRDGQIRITSYGSYRHTVDYVTKLVWQRFEGVLLPAKRPGLATDHMYSVASAYFNADRSFITVSELCHPANLQLLTTAENSRKHTTNAHNASQLRKRIEEWNIVYGDPMTQVVYHGTDLHVLPHHISLPDLLADKTNPEE